MHKDAQVIVDYCRANLKRNPQEAFTVEFLDAYIATLKRQSEDPRLKPKHKDYEAKLAKYQLIRTFFKTGKVRAK
ncbi:MAG: hypothetical protein ACFBZ9_14195 [Sphingomonadales bacterium]